jgi:hypothetical protein
MLTLNPPNRDRDDAVWHFFAKLDSVILGDETLVTQRGVRQLTTFSRGTAKMDAFLAEFQLKVELVQSLGKHIDADILGMMLLDESGLLDLDRRLLMAATQRRVEYGTVFRAMRLHFAEEPKGDAYEAREVGVDSQEVFETNRFDNKLIETPRRPPRDPSSWHCFDCHVMGHKIIDCPKPKSLSRCTSGHENCLRYFADKS